MFRKLTKGFTLIELLIVIGILGVLASAVVVMLDPGEQIKKSQDAGVKTTAASVDRGIKIYTTNHGSSPWNDNSNCATELGSGNYLSDIPTCLDMLIQSGDITQNINSNQSSTQLHLKACSTNAVVCFKPTSKAQKTNESTKYNIGGTVEAGCPSQDESIECYWCTSACN